MPVPVLVDLDRELQGLQLRPGKVPRSLIQKPPARAPLFRVHVHPPSSWGLIEHDITATTVLYNNNGSPLVLARILREAQRVLKDRENVNKIIAAAFNYDNYGKLIFYMDHAPEPHARMLLDAAIRDAAFRLYGMRSQVSSRVDDFPIAVDSCVLMLSMLREFPVAPCP